jgi:hypothetical protein
MNLGVIARVWLAAFGTCLFAFAYLCSFPAAKINMTPAGSLLALPRILIGDRYATPIGVISLTTSFCIFSFLYFTRNKGRS